MPREDIDIMLDRKRNITVNPANFPFPNMHALDYLPFGVHQLADIVRRDEIAFNRNLPIPGSDVDMPGQMGQFASYFNWFCSSFTNYLRLVGFVELATQYQWSSHDVTANMHEVKRHCGEYVCEVVSDIVKWRNKIAAHSALTDPRSSDGAALLEYSVIDFVSYRHPYLTAGVLQLDDFSGRTSDMPTWALTEVFERSKPRFWPEREIHPFTLNT